MTKEKKQTLGEELGQLLDEADEQGETARRKISRGLVDAAAGGNIKAFELIRELVGEEPEKEPALPANERPLVAVRELTAKEARDALRALGYVKGDDIAAQ